MSNPRERPTFASPEGLPGRLTLVTAAAWACAAAVVAASLPTIVPPLPIQELMPQPTTVVARTPASPQEARP